MLRVPVIAHADGQLGQFIFRVGQRVRLHVQHDLQQVFDLAEKRIVVGQKRPFGQRQAADLGKLHDGVERVAGPQLRQITAVEQLQELDHEFDITNAAMSRLDVPLVGSLSRRT